MHSPCQLAHSVSHTLYRHHFFESVLNPANDNNAGLGEHKIDRMIKIFNQVSIAVSPNAILHNERTKQATNPVFQAIGTR
jgi:hypothetical protein